MPHQIVLFPNSCFKLTYSSLTMHVSIIWTVIYRFITHLFVLKNKCQGKINYFPRDHSLCNYICIFSNWESAKYGQMMVKSQLFSCLFGFYILAGDSFLTFETITMKVENWALRENGTGTDRTRSPGSKQDQP